MPHEEPMLQETAEEPRLPIDWYGPEDLPRPEREPAQPGPEFLQRMRRCCRSVSGLLKDVDAADTYRFYLPDGRKLGIMCPETSDEFCWSIREPATTSVDGLEGFIFGELPKHLFMLMATYLDDGIMFEALRASAIRTDSARAIWHQPIGIREAVQDLVFPGLPRKGRKPRPGTTTVKARSKRRISKAAGRTKAVAADVGKVRAARRVGPPVPSDPPAQADAQEPVQAREDPPAPETPPVVVAAPQEPARTAAEASPGTTFPVPDRDDGYPDGDGVGVLFSEGGSSWLVSIPRDGAMTVRRQRPLEEWCAVDATSSDGLEAIGTVRTILGACEVALGDPGMEP